VVKSELAEVNSNPTDDSLPKSRQPPIYLTPGIGDGLFIFGVVIFFLFLICAYFVLVYGKKYPELSLILGRIWIIFVPIFFFIEHTYFFRKYGDPQQYDQFKRLQDFSAKVWAAAIVILAAYFTHSYPAVK